MTDAAQAVRVAVARADLMLCALGGALPWIGGAALAALVTCAVICRMLK